MVPTFGLSVQMTVNAFTLDAVTDITLRGPASEVMSGPVLVALMPLMPPILPTRYTLSFVTGAIPASAFQIIADGLSYIQIDTADFPNGILRGQVSEMPMPSFTPLPGKGTTVIPSLTQVDTTILLRGTGLSAATFDQPALFSILVTQLNVSATRITQFAVTQASGGVSVSYGVAVPPGQVANIATTMSNLVSSGRLLQALQVSNNASCKFRRGATFFRVTPLLRVKIKITVKIAVCEESSATTYDVFDCEVDLTRKRGAALKQNGRFRGGHFHFFLGGGVS